MSQHTDFHDLDIFLAQYVQEFPLPRDRRVDTITGLSSLSTHLPMFRSISLTVLIAIHFVCSEPALWSQTDAVKENAANGLWTSHVAKLLSDNCQKCHNDQKKSGRLDLSSVDSILEGGKKGKTVVPGKPDESMLYRLILPGAKPHMPPGGKQLSQEQISILKRWIQKLDSATLERSTSENVTPGSDETSKRRLPDGVDPTTIIDLLVEEKWSTKKLKVAPRVDDRKFACRLYLDLVGRIPTPEELSSFDKDSGSDKRSRLIDQLLGSEEHAEYFASVIDTLLMGRGSAGQYGQRKSVGWNDFLKSAIQQNRPWDDVVRDILLARPTDAKSKGSVWFLYERNNQHQEIAEAIAPAVFGIRIECAQCHDHPLAGEIEQRHYWGLVAFFKRGKNGNSKLGPRVVESAIGGFEEFTDLSGKSYPNELVFFGKPVVKEMRPKAGKKQKDSKDLYVSTENSGGPRVPKFSRRKEFVEKVLNEHPLVARAMVNRVWALFMGRGIVHPFDKMDSAHPPSHPELLDWLSSDFQSHDYDVRRLIRKILNSRAYQLDSKQPAADSDPATFAWSLEKPLTAEAWTRSIAQLLRGSTGKQSELIGDFRKSFPDVLPEENMTRLDQTMFLSNGKSLDKFIRESHGRSDLHTRLMQLKSHKQIVKTLYNEAFAREPSENELQKSLEFLNKRNERLSQALDMMIWAVITSAEFRINH